MNPNFTNSVQLVIQFESPSCGRDLLFLFRLFQQLTRQLDASCCWEHAELELHATLIFVSCCFPSVVLLLLLLLNSATLSLIIPLKVGVKISISLILENVAKKFSHEITLVKTCGSWCFYGIFLTTIMPCSTCSRKKWQSTSTCMVLSWKELGSQWGELPIDCHIKEQLVFSFNYFYFKIIK